MRKALGADLVVKGLEDSGIEFVFGIPGTHNVELYGALIESTKLKPILITDEQSAGFMADGVSRSGGGLAAINLVPGAGMTNALSGIAECYLDQVPLLVLACGIRADTGSSYQLHDIDQVKMVSGVTKEVYQPQTHSEIYQSIREAAELAQKAPAGPVVVEIPANLYLLKGDVETTHYQPLPPHLETLELTLLHKAIENLNSSQSIGLYLGLGAREAGPQLINLAERLDAIVFTTISGKSVFPEHHERWAWNTMGRALPKRLKSLESELDCILAIGCRFAETATASYGFPEPNKLIHVDIDSEVFNKNYQTSVSINSTSKVFVEKLLASPKLIQKNQNKNRLKKLAEAHKEVFQSFSKPAKKNLVSPFQMVSSFQKKFEDDTVYVTDSGNGTFLAMEMLRLKKSHSFLAPVDFSCMGYSVPAAIGAKFANPNRPVVAFTGDGAFLMTGLELLTAKTHGLGLVICILRDGKLSQIAQFQNMSLKTEICTDLAPLRFQKIAEAIGLPYLSVTDSMSMETCALEAKKLSQTGQSVVLEVPIDYSVPTYFTQGVVKTNFLRFGWKDRVRLVSRVVGRAIRPPNPIAHP